MINLKTSSLQALEGLRASVKAEVHAQARRALLLLGAMLLGVLTLGVVIALAAAGTFFALSESYSPQGAAALTALLFSCVSASIFLFGYLSVGSGRRAKAAPASPKNGSSPDPGPAPDPGLAKDIAEIERLIGETERLSAEIRSLTRQNKGPAVLAALVAGVGFGVSQSKRTHQF